MIAGKEWKYIYIISKAIAKRNIERQIQANIEWEAVALNLKERSGHLVDLQMFHSRVCESVIRNV